MSRRMKNSFGRVLASSGNGYRKGRPARSETCAFLLALFITYGSAAC